MTDTAAARFEAGRRMLPNWNEEGPDADARQAAGVALITEAAREGHVPAMKVLADGLAGPETFAWAIEVARRGDPRPLQSCLTDGDWPAEACLAVLAEARDGAPWAQVAVAGVYLLGMADHATGELVATRDGAWGWLPGAADPHAEGLAWLRRAADAGWPHAHLALAHQLQFDAREEALVHARVALDAGLPPLQARQAGKLVVRLLEKLGAPADEVAAAWRTMADLGDGDAMFWLAERHRKGADGVAKDLAAARDLYARAAEAGCVPGYRELGKLLEKGQGGAKDLERARAMYEQAAELGNDPYSRDRLAKAFGLAWYARRPGER